MVRMILFLLTPAFLVFGACNQQELDDLKQENSELRQKVQSLSAGSKAQERLNFLGSHMTGLKARIVTDAGVIEASFYPDKAPIHCFNFITRAESGFYNGTYFHRVIPGFMIQGGDPNTKDKDPNNDGMGGPAVAIPHEFSAVHHKPGILSMARVGDVNQGAGSQFFVMHGDSPNLDNQYTVFGEVLKGMDVVDKIATAAKGANDRPLKPVLIQKIEIYR